MLARDLEGMSFRIAFITIAFFDTSLSMILLKQEWLNMACPQNFRFFFFENSTVRSLRSHARASWSARKKERNYVFFSFSHPHPDPLQLADNKSLAVFISIRARDNI